MSTREERLKAIKRKHEAKKAEVQAALDRVNGKESKGFGEKPEVQYPSLAQQAKNLVQTAADVVRDPRWVDDAEYDRRMAICRECSLFDHKQVRCKKCGCKLKGKARFKAGSCPIQKW